MFCKIVLATALLAMAVASPVQKTPPKGPGRIKVPGKEKAVWRTPSQTSAPNKLITEQEYIDILKEQFPEGDPRHYGSLMWRRYYDINNVGSIEEGELARASSKLVGGNLEETLNTLFYIYDVNDDGHLTKNELREVDDMIVKAMGQVDSTPRNLLGAFATIDTDHDDQLTLEEVLALRGA